MPDLSAEIEDQYAALTWPTFLFILWFLFFIFFYFSQAYFQKFIWSDLKAVREAIWLSLTDNFISVAQFLWHLDGQRCLKGLHCSYWLILYWTTQNLSTSKYKHMVSHMFPVVLSRYPERRVFFRQVPRHSSDGRLQKAAQNGRGTVQVIFFSLAQKKKNRTFSFSPWGEFQIVYSYLFLLSSSVLFCTRTSQQV